MIIGIDIGSTTTKAVVVENQKILNKIKIKASDAITSATGVLGKLTLDNDIHINQIDRIIITGAGASKIRSNIFDIETQAVDEITAIGCGGIYLSSIDPIIITNIGTGTAIIEASHGKATHIGGSGVGGGTIVGLSKAMLNISSFNTIIELAEKGNINEIDLSIRDIVDTEISFLKPDSTASNFGKMQDTARKEDIALGIINMVYQVIGMLSVFAARAKNQSKVLVTGNGSNNVIGKKVLNEITHMYKIDFIYPADAEYATAIGAALQGRH
jgi:type II pantothenate kinase